MKAVECKVRIIVKRVRYLNSNMLPRFPLGRQQLQLHPFFNRNALDTNLMIKYMIKEPLSHLKFKSRFDFELGH